MKETVYEVNLIDLGFGEYLRLNNEEFRTVTWEVIPDANQTKSFTEKTGAESGTEKEKGFYSET